MPLKGAPDEFSFDAIKKRSMLIARRYENIFVDIEIKRLSKERFRKFITKKNLVGSPTSATPGLSRHGQSRAIDFYIKGPGVKLGAGNSKGWDKGGWTKLLKEAVLKSSKKFKGPLPRPYEPWHYNYYP